MIEFQGMRVIEDPRCAPPVEMKQVRFPRSKRRRIRKKWARREVNWELIQNPRPFFLCRDPSGERYILAHPAAIAILRQQVQL